MKNVDATCISWSSYNRNEITSNRLQYHQSRVPTGNGVWLIKRKNRTPTDLAKRWSNWSWSNNIGFTCLYPTLFWMTYAASISNHRCAHFFSWCDSSDAHISMCILLSKIFIVRISRGPDRLSNLTALHKSACEYSPPYLCPWLSKNLLIRCESSPINVVYFDNQWIPFADSSMSFIKKKLIIRLWSSAASIHH